MEKSSYGMAKFGLEAKEAMPKRDCGFYVKYIFLFTSLIQFLIILGLVLFMVYGNAQAGTDMHLRLLEKDLQERYGKIITLTNTNTNLTRTLNATLKEKQGLQALAQKVQRDLDKCNSTQAPTSIPKCCPLPVPGRAVTLRRGVGVRVWEETVNPNPVSPANPAAEKVLLQSRLDQMALAKKELGESYRNANATLTKTTQEQRSCQRQLDVTKNICESTKTNLELQKHECNSLKSDVRYYFERIKEMLSSYSCNSAQEQLSRLAQQTERLFLWQQDRETKYVGKSVCDMNLNQCHLNCSEEKQELEKRLQDAEKRAKGGQEEKAKLVAEKERLGKELEEKSKAAAQAGYFKEQLNFCMGSKV
ncbi:PLVAP protein, partial [Ardeotis kori]|nr:PLVAP protein [Ardeotis kori]